MGKKWRENEIQYLCMKVSKIMIVFKKIIVCMYEILIEKKKPELRLCIGVTPAWG